MVDYIKQLEEEQSKKENIEFAPGDTVEVYQKIIEGNREKENRESMLRIGVYGKSKHPNEHLHIKLCPAPVNRVPTIRMNDLFIAEGAV